MRLLLIEDSERLRELVTEAVRAAGWRIDAVGSMAEAEAATAVAQYDALLLDLGLPDGDGVELIRARRAARDQTPILVLSARAGVDDRIGGLDAGADDYLAKPFNSRELLARVRALMRRAPLSAQPVLEAGRLRFDPAAGSAFCGDEPVKLSPRERALLEILMRNVGRVVTSGHLEEALSEFEGTTSRNAVELVLSRLRRKLSPFDVGAAIETVRSVGYLLREVG
ncbi:response regulator transcription factor [Chenggangzhangella methanolivorans]|uniref:Response regulator transcription factor n=1 Tax=Chenggangzhangella methanolivorans TaxID=1437009 RepID=A0A9E6RBV9_9HYPH|nr:response regulator transcription factor [Chenggangzhangella methanolivorans]QZO01931.1 response regulator transcription factor [Chenggangzhangella methanolivorans]